MTEIPEHLLERSKARRAALGLLKDGETASSTTPVKAGDADAAPAAAAAAPAARAAAAPAPVAIKAPEPVPPYVAAALARKKMPFWVVPVLLFLPIWMILYVGTLERPPTAPDRPTGRRRTTVRQQVRELPRRRRWRRCRTPAQRRRNVLLTFPNAADHVWWVVNGSAGVGVGIAATATPIDRAASTSPPVAWPRGPPRCRPKNCCPSSTTSASASADRPKRPKSGSRRSSDSPDLPANFTEGMTAARSKRLITAAETAAGVTAAAS